MKIAIPLANGLLCMHFGHCAQFAIVETDDATGKVTKVEYLTPPPHEPGVLPRWLCGMGVGVVIAGGMGPAAQELFASQGVKVFAGAPAMCPEELAEAYVAGRLTAGVNVCNHLEAGVVAPGGGRGNFYQRRTAWHWLPRYRFHLRCGFGRGRNRIHCFSRF